MILQLVIQVITKSTCIIYMWIIYVYYFIFNLTPIHNYNSVYILNWLNKYASVQVRKKHGKPYQYGKLSKYE